MSSSPVLLWFRDDLRITDQPAVHAAAKSGAPVLAFYVFEEGSGLRPFGGASLWWLHHALEALGRDLESIGSQLFILRGDARKIVPALAEASGASHAFWTRRYGGAEIETDKDIKSRLKDLGIIAESYNGQLLFEPWDVRNKAGDPFRVFTPFWRSAREGYQPPALLAKPRKLAAAKWPAKAPKALSLASLNLLPTKPDWAGGMRATWTPGEAGAKKRLTQFIDGPLNDYAEGRDFADRQSTSMLSPHLRFGEISPRQIWNAVTHAVESGKATSRNVDKFLSEIGWREFSYHLLFHNPELATKNFNARFDDFPWGKANAGHVHAWQKGLTGYPIVDAGMRELWQTGYMHNRVRMIAASFLIKHLMIDWRTGEEWFWDTLCDADPANNSASWQWVAGSGADAAPYFRIFNPIIQGEKFDPNGDYVRKYVPELAKLDSKFIHKPWTATPMELKAAGVTLGKTYPEPVVEHNAARERALAAFEKLKG